MNMKIMALGTGMLAGLGVNYIPFFQKYHNAIIAIIGIVLIIYGFLKR